MPFEGSPPSRQGSDDDNLATPSGDNGPGEFTQLFRSLQAEIPKQEQRQVQSPAITAPVAATPSAAGEFTQVFRQIAKPTSQPPEIPASPLSASPPGEFTQFFRPPLPGAISQTPQVRQSDGVLSSAQVRSEEPFPELFSQRDEGMPKRECGAASNMFAAQTPAFPQPLSDRPSKDSFAPRFASEAAAASSVVPPRAEISPASAATRIFDALGPAAQRPSPGFSDVPLNPVASSPSIQTGAGEFTRLMQNLQTPAPPEVPVTPSRFAAPAASTSGESEFTRVIRSSNARAAQPAVPAQGIAMASAASASQADAKSESKSAKSLAEKPWVIWLLVANLILFLIVLVVGVLLLLRHR